MIEIANLQVTRDGKPICRVAELSVATGERLAILGANGSGKTTLLRVLAGFVNDYTGKCQVAAALTERTFLHQQPYLFRGSVLANACYGQQSGVAQESGGEAWLERLQVGHLAQRSTTDLSGGERRRVALARALAMQPQLLLLDEPLADLDDDASAIVCQTLSQLADTTIVIASPIDLPAELVDQVVTISP